MRLAALRERSFFPAYLFSLVIWIVASLPGEELETIQHLPENVLLRIILSDPFMHFLVFGLLALLVFRGFYQRAEKTIPWVKVAIISSGYGLIIELYQSLLPWRGFGLDDLLWNTAGALVFLLLVRIVRKPLSSSHTPDSIFESTPQPVKK